MDKWVSCSELKPKAGKLYLVTVKEGKRVYTTVAWWELNTWWMIAHNGWATELKGAQAWMELPKPYIKGI